MKNETLSKHTSSCTRSFLILRASKNMSWTRNIEAVIFLCMLLELVGDPRSKQKQMNATNNINRDNTRPVYVVTSSATDGSAKYCNNFVLLVNNETNFRFFHQYFFK